MNFPASFQRVPIVIKLTIYNKYYEDEHKRHSFSGNKVPLCLFVRVILSLLLSMPA